VKKLVAIIIILSITLSACSYFNSDNVKPEDHKPPQNKNSSSKADTLNAVWINYYELSMEAQKGGSQALFTEKISTMFSNLRKQGIDTAIVQVRPYSDAFYKSSIYPYSKYITGTQGKDPGYDPLAVICEQAKKYSLKIHAWINPYRVLYSTDFSKLSKDNPARKWHEDDNKGNDDWIFILDNGIYYNPAIPEVRKIIIDGAKEILLNYDVDAIHMDDYFYPSVNDNIDKRQYDAYKSSGGLRSLSDWRRDNVNTFVSGLYSAIKSIDPDCEIGISPCGDIEKNHTELYADIGEWMSKDGYIDYIAPQVYYGFENETLPFEKVARQWSDLCGNKVKIYYGLAVYKCGVEDEFGGKGKNEWKNKDDIINRQIKFVCDLPAYDGIIFYSYKSFMNNIEDIDVKNKKQG
jgi:uncharacterized lipoprotein YddW (UPF0748 family)